LAQGSLRVSGRGGALLAAAAGCGRRECERRLPGAAATGDPVELGVSNTAAASTLVEADGAALATLSLANREGATPRLVSYGEDAGDLDLTGAELYENIPTPTAQASSRTTTARVLKAVRAVPR